MVVRNRLVDAVRFHEAAQRDGRRTSHHETDDVPASGPRPCCGDSPVADEEEVFRELLGEFEEREQLLIRARLEQSASYQDLADQLGYSSRCAAQRAFYSAQTKLLMRLRRRKTDRNQ